VQWSDDLWDEVWDRTLSSVERNRIARAALARELPHDALERRLVPELARRWRRSARNHAIAHLALLTFWALLWGTDPTPVRDSDLSTFVFAVGGFNAAVIAVAVVFRRYLVPVTLIDRVVEG
jgi:hypothetical protein